MNIVREGGGGVQTRPNKDFTSICLYISAHFCTQHPKMSTWWSLVEQLYPDRHVHAHKQTNIHPFIDRTTISLLTYRRAALWYVRVRKAWQAVVCEVHDPPEPLDTTVNVVLGVEVLRLWHGLEDHFSVHFELHQGEIFEGRNFVQDFREGHKIILLT